MFHARSSSRSPSPHVCRQQAVEVLGRDAILLVADAERQLLGDAGAVVDEVDDGDLFGSSSRSRMRSGSVHWLTEPHPRTSTRPGRRDPSVASRAVVMFHPSTPCLIEVRVSTGCGRAELRTLMRRRLAVYESLINV